MLIKYQYNVASRAAKNALNFLATEIIQFSGVLLSVGICVCNEAVIRLCQMLRNSTQNSNMWSSSDHLM